jgi:hypothetical protein
MHADFVGTPGQFAKPQSAMLMRIAKSSANISNGLGGFFSACEITAAAIFDIALPVGGLQIFFPPESIVSRQTGFVINQLQRRTRLSSRNLAIIVLPETLA